MEGGKVGNSLNRARLRGLSSGIGEWVKMGRVGFHREDICKKVLVPIRIGGGKGGNLTRTRCWGDLNLDGRKSRRPVERAMGRQGCGVRVKQSGGRGPGKRDMGRGGRRGAPSLNGVDRIPGLF